MIFKFIRLFIFAVMMFSPAYAANFHLFIVGDTYATDIGRSVTVDIDQIKKFGSNVARSLGMGYYPTVYAGDLLHGEAIRKRISEIRSQPDDIIFFYYSGHGYETNIKYPGLSMAHRYRSPLTSGEVITGVQKRPARFYFFIFDTCNGGITNLAKNGFLVDETQTVPQLDVQRLSQLFAGTTKTHTNVIVIALGAKKGGFSYGNSIYGGIFTQSFLQSFYRIAGRGSYERATWHNILESTRRTTLQTKINDGDQQSPMYRIGGPGTNYIKSPGS